MKVLAAHEADLTADLHQENSYYAFGKWLYHPEQVEHVKEGNFRAVTPVTVQLIPTLYCNFGCPRCSYGQAKEDMSIHKDQTLMHMNLPTMMTIIDRLEEAGLKAIVFTGGGEPTLNKHLIEGMAYARGKGFKIGLFTNGSLLDQEKIEAMMSLEPTFLRVSLDAGSPVAHRLLHGYTEKHGYFDTILKNLKVMAKTRQRLGLTTTIGVGVSVEPINLNDLVQVARRLREISQCEPDGGIDYLVFRPMVNYDKGKFFHMAKPLLEQLKQDMPEYYQDYRAYMYEGKQLPARLFARASEIIDGPVREVLADTGIQVINIRTKMIGITRNQRPFHKCRASSWYIFVGPDGTVYNCVELGLDPRVALGNLQTHSLAEIWQSEQRRKVLDYIDSAGLNNLCPPVCLYYELNTLFEKLDRLFQAGEDRRAQALRWIAHHEALVQVELETGKFTQAHHDFI
jgi:radical SAM protein with 4Fe4S-binding SPASM domain